MLIPPGQSLLSPIPTGTPKPQLSLTWPPASALCWRTLLFPFSPLELCSVMSESADLPILSQTNKYRPGVGNGEQGQQLLCPQVLSSAAFAGKR